MKSGLIEIGLHYPESLVWGTPGIGSQVTPDSASRHRSKCIAVIIIGILCKIRILCISLLFLGDAVIDTNYNAGHVPAVEAKAIGGTSRHCKPLAIVSFDQWIKFMYQDWTTGLV